MKKLYARIVPLVFVLGACSSSDEPAADPSVPVGFSVQTETRAAVTGTTLPDGSLFKVWGGYDGNNVFDGREVTKTASGCTYTGTEYWVPGKTYNFHAVYPAELPAGATLTVAGDGTVSVSNFDCSATGDAAVDLMTASAPDIKADEIIASQNPVELTFSHLLSHISFVFDNQLTGGYAAEVTDISFSIQVKGNYISTEASPWTNLIPGAITLYPAAAPLTVANGSSVTSDPALVIPQSNTGVNVTFTVTIREIIDEATGSTTMTVVKRFTSPLATTDGEWKMGQRYEYKATLTDELMEMDDLKQITLVVKITDWLVEDANVSWGGETAAP
uniref:fimbrillin family protein n=1 Tax=Phocaeicola coprophilus TaxID=387090 RepID=UPI0040287483